jgi:hypothetical protein
MKTHLPEKIKGINHAEKFLTELYENGEAFHPDDDAHEVVWANAQVSFAEEEKLNLLMEQISNLRGFDPCGFLLGLDPNYEPPEPDMTQ